MSSPDQTPSADVEALLRKMAAAPSIEPSAELFPLSEGTVVADTYRIEARIGAGGMGVVYRATDLALGRPVALKLHRRAPDPGRLDRLMREASVMARMSHPNVVTIYEVGHYEDEDARLFVAMEYVDGGSAVDWAKAQPRSWRDVLAIYLQAADGLAAAHAAGVVHRDFKPHNVLIDLQGRARVADFGLARLDADPQAPSLESARGLISDTTTRDGTIVGTPAYMAPEQWRGQPGNEASDQYAFCVSLYEQLYGDNPLAAQRSQLEPEGDVEWTPPKDTRVPGRVLRILRRGLSEDPKARFEDMGALRAELRRQTEPTALGTFAVGIAAAVGGLSVWAVMEDPAADCDGEAAIAATWNDDARADVATTLRGSNLPYAETAARNATALLDAYAQAWVEEDDAACRARGETQVAAQRACLRTYRRRFEAMVQALPQADDAGRRRAMTAISELPEPSACATPGPATTFDQERFDDLATRLDALDAAVALRQDARAAELLDGLTEDVAAADRTEFTARLSLLAGKHGLHHGSADEAIDRFDQALSAGLKLGDDRELAEIATELSIALNRRNRPREAQRALLIAEAAAETVDVPVSLRVKLITARGSVLIGSNSYEEALEVLQTGLALAEAELGEDHPSTASMLDNLTVPLVRLHRHDEALEANARATEIIRRVEGEGHPAMARLLEGRGVTYFAMGKPQLALDPLREALRMRTQTDPTGASTVELAANLSSALLTIGSDRGENGGELDEARGLLEPLAQRLEQEDKADLPGNAQLWENLGSIEVRQGRIEDGIALIERALVSLEASYGPDSVRLGPALSKLANAQDKLGRHDEARASATRARKVAIAGKANPADLARVELSLAIIERNAGNLDEARRVLDVGMKRAREAGAAPLIERYEQELAALAQR